MSTPDPSSDPGAARRLGDAVAGALALIEARRAPETPGPAAPRDRPPAALAALLDRCEALRREDAADGHVTVATLHHLACTGGTLIARLLGVMPGTVLLNEIDPLSRFDLPARMTQFAPTDLILAMRRSLRMADDAAVAAVYLATIEAMRTRLRRQGQRLLLRDHAHSMFCAGAGIPDRPTLHGLMAGAMPLRALVTLRHPMASFLSLQASGWVHFRPGTLEEYAARSHAFLDAHAGVPTMRYEDLLADPEPWLRQACDRLGLTYAPGAPALIPGLRTSGDSGRAGDVLAPRPPRPVPDDLARQAAGSPLYARLCERTGYDPAGQGAAPLPGAKAPIQTRSGAGDSPEIAAAGPH